MLLDLNARKAARAAALSEPMAISLDEETFTLVNELPLAAMDKALHNDISGALKLMLAEPSDWDRLMSVNPTIQDVLAIVEFYGTTLGESSASTGSSTGTGA